MKIIKSPDPNKAHGHDSFNIGTLKNYGNSMCRPLELIQRIAWPMSYFSYLTAKKETAPVHKKVINSV